VNSSVTVSGNQVGACNVSSTTVASCSFFSGDSVPAKASVTVVLGGVLNPTTAKSYSLSLSTSSDVTAVTSPSYTVTAAGKVTALRVKLSSAVTGAANVTYTVQFKTDTGLSATSGSSIPITFPSGTGLSGLTDTAVTVAGTEVGDCAETSATELSCGFFSGDTVAAGATVVVSLVGITNPATTKAYKLTVSTTSDVKPVTSHYCVAASGVPCIAKVTPASGLAGTAVTITGINLSGATAVDFNGTAAVISSDAATEITTTVPANATTGPVTATTPGGTATSPSPFTVT
jgi:hypothetical protein